MWHSNPIYQKLIIPIVQIDLIDGEELISKIAEYGIGVKEVKSYEIDEDFFEKI